MRASQFHENCRYTTRKSHKTVYNLENYKYILMTKLVLPFFYICSAQLCELIYAGRFCLFLLPRNRCGVYQLWQGKQQEKQKSFPINLKGQNQCHNTGNKQKYKYNRESQQITADVSHLSTVSLCPFGGKLLGPPGRADLISYLSP